jgi:hypothetical protein
MIAKFKVSILLLLFFTSFLAVASASSDLSKADSLFFNKKYTEAFEVYTSLQENSSVSASMLLKMAFIKEGLGDYTSSLYYLYNYYQLTNDRAVLVKMSELADKKSLSGYTVEDKHFFINAINKYLTEIQLLLAFTLLFLTLFTYRSKEKKELPIGVPVIQLVLAVVLLAVTNGWFQPNQAIIKDNTFLMSAPSAASEPIGPITKGHLVEVLEQTDVWTKVRWNEEEVFLRKSKLRNL